MLKGRKWHRKGFAHVKKIRLKGECCPAWAELQGQHPVPCQQKAGFAYLDHVIRDFYLNHMIRDINFPELQNELVKWRHSKTDSQGQPPRYQKQEYGSPMASWTQPRKSLSFDLCLRTGKQLGPQQKSNIRQAF